MRPHIHPFMHSFNQHLLCLVHSGGTLGKAGALSAFIVLTFHLGLQKSLMSKGVRGPGSLHLGSTAFTVGRIPAQFSLSFHLTPVTFVL